MNHDILDLEGIKLTTFIGIYAWEKKHPQQVIVDISISLKKMTKELKLENSVDYSQICQDLKCYEHLSFDLIENLAWHIAHAIKSNYANCQAVQISITKQVNLFGEPKVKFTTQL